MRRALFLLISGLALCPGVASAHEIRARKPDLKILAASPKLPEGRLGGDGWQQGWIEAGGELKLEQQFLAGQPAAVTVLAAPFAPLAVTVGETGEAPICRGASRACRWQPAFTGRYAIVLHNGGGARVRYVLMVR